MHALRLPLLFLILILRASCPTGTLALCFRLPCPRALLCYAERGNCVSSQAGIRIALKTKRKVVIWLAAVPEKENNNSA